MKWETVLLGKHCSKIGSGATPKGGASVYIENGTAFIRSQNVYNLFFAYDGLVFIDDDASRKLNNVTIQKDDILLNITGDSVARTCIVPNEILPARVNQHVAIIRPYKESFLPKFLSYYLVSPYMQAYMLNLAVGKGASRNALSKEIIERFPICMLADETKITWQWLFFKLYENREKFNAIAKGAGQQNISSDTVKNTAIILPTKQTIDLFTNQVKVIKEQENMSYDYSENILIQGSAGDLLRDQLGWDVQFAYRIRLCYVADRI